MSAGAHNLNPSRAPLQLIVGSPFRVTSETVGGALGPQRMEQQAVLDEH